MTRNHEIDYTLSTGEEVTVRYSVEPGGFADQEDQLTIDSVLDADGNEVSVDHAEEQRIIENLCEMEADSGGRDDWRNEWD